MMDQPPSKFDFKLNLRRYTKVWFRVILAMLKMNEPELLRVGPGS